MQEEVKSRQNLNGRLTITKQLKGKKKTTTKSITNSKAGVKGHSERNISTGCSFLDNPQSKSEHAQNIAGVPRVWGGRRGE